MVCSTWHFNPPHPPVSVILLELWIPMSWVVPTCSKQSRTSRITVRSYSVLPLRCMETWVRMVVRSVGMILFSFYPYGESKALLPTLISPREICNRFMKGFITRHSHTGPRRGRIFSISSDAIRSRMMRGYQDRVLLVGNLSTTRVVMDVRDTVERTTWL